jgi:hypothetical protein
LIFFVFRAQKRTLDQHIGVRIPGGQPIFTLSPVPAPDEPNRFVASLPSRMQTLRRKSDKPGNSVHHRHCAAMKNGESNDPKAAGVASYSI